MPEVPYALALARSSRSALWGWLLVGEYFLTLCLHTITQNGVPLTINARTRLCVMELRIVDIEKSEETSVILAQAHFIKTVEDVYESIVSAVPGAKFGLAFNEASGPRLVRYDGNDDGLIKLAVTNSEKIGAGHLLVIMLEGAYPINVLNSLKHIQEITTIYSASSNPARVVIAVEGEGIALLGVMDGMSPRARESDSQKLERHEFLRKIGYKK